MSDSIWADLRKPFTAEEIGKLPRVTCGDCSDRRKECTKHSKSKCNVCGAYVSEKHIHIDYVGHADVTSRLLAADPEWNWEPKAEDEHGMPVFDMDGQGNPVGLWIKLTVGGVTRLGYGSVPSGQPDAVKVLIGDALRNGAMRFGVALDLWAKGDRADPSAENATASAGHARRGGQSAGDVFENSRPAPQPKPRHAERMASVPADDPWYGAGPPDVAAAEAEKPTSRPRVTRPEAAETDQVWLDLMGQEIEQIKTREDGTKAWASIAAAFKGNTCSAADRKALEALVAGRVSEVVSQEKSAA